MALPGLVQAEAGGKGEVKKDKGILFLLHVRSQAEMGRGADKREKADR